MNHVENVSEKKKCLNIEAKNKLTQNEKKLFYFSHSTIVSSN